VNRQHRLFTGYTQRYVVHITGDMYYIGLSGSLSGYLHITPDCSPISADTGQLHSFHTAFTTPFNRLTNRVKLTFDTMSRTGASENERNGHSKIPKRLSPP
jgi:hypothetical protein